MLRDVACRPKAGWEGLTSRPARRPYAARRGLLKLDGPRTTREYESRVPAPTPADRAAARTYRPANARAGDACLPSGYRPATPEITARPALVRDEPDVPWTLAPELDDVYVTSS